MYQTDNIKGLARELGIDYGTSSSSQDQLRKIAEQVGINSYNSLYDNNRLEEKLRNLKRDKYPQIKHYNAMRNISSSSNNRNNLNKKNGNTRNNSRMVNELASKGVQSAGVPKPLADAIVNSKLGQKAIEAAKKKNPALNLLDKLTGDSKKETEESVSDGGTINFKIPTKVKKWALICSGVGIFCIIFVCLIMSSVQVFIKAIGLGNADSLSASEVEEKIDKKKDDEKALGTETTDANANTPTAYNIFIDDKSKKFKENKLNEVNLVQIASNKYLTRKYNEADLDNIEDFYPSIKNVSKDYDENMVYDFYYKMYKLYTTYRDTYHVYLDMPLLMATLNLQSDDMNEIFSSNMSKNWRKTKKDMPLEELDYYKEWTNYKTTPTKSTNDMEILAQNMVSVTTSDKCENPVGDKCYVIDEDKYTEFLKEFIEKKYYLSGKTIDSGQGNSSSSINSSSNTNNTPSSGDYRNWKQKDPRWADKIIAGTDTMGSFGCLITSLAIQIARSGTKTVVSPIDPSVALKYFKFDDEAGLYWGSITNLAPNFIETETLRFENMNRKSIAEKLLSYDLEKKYIILMVKTSGKDHYVALDYVDSSNNKLYMIDPNSVSTDLYFKYVKVYTAIVFEKRD